MSERCLADDIILMALRRCVCRGDSPGLCEHVDIGDMCVAGLVAGNLARLGTGRVVDELVALVRTADGHDLQHVREPVRARACLQDPGVPGLVRRSAMPATDARDHSVDGP